MNGVSHLAKQLQAGAHQWRLPIRLKQAIELRDEWLAEHDAVPADHEATGRPGSSTPTALLDLRHVRWDGPQGRRFHALASMLRHGGFDVYLPTRLRILQTAHRTYKRAALAGLRPWAFSAERSHRFDLVISDQSSIFGSQGSQSPGGRTIRLVDHFRPRGGPSEVPVPFTIHPDLIDQGWLNRLPQIRQSFGDQARPWHLFFGGCRDPHSYRARGEHPAGLINRHDLTEMALGYYSDETIELNSAQSASENARISHSGLAFCDANQYRIPVAKWLPMMARANFFLAGPGIKYPMSHNAVEALAVGTIPILQYADLFQPALVDGVNCLTYDDPVSFNGLLHRIGKMPAAEIASLRRGAMDYFDEHLSPQAFTRRLQDPAVRRAHLFPYLVDDSHRQVWSS